MKKVCVIGAGFAGSSAARQLSKRGSGIDLTVIDRGGKFNFLPMLPDVIGRNIDPGYLACGIEAASRKLGFKFIKDEVVSLDLGRKQLSTSTQTLDYDLLLICCGSETNFYGNEQLRQRAFKLDDTADAEKLRAVLDTQAYDSFIISGGGYTGIEVATNLRLYLNKRKLDKRIIIVERAQSILGPLPQWMKDYVSDNLRGLKVEVIPGGSIEEVRERQVRLAGGAVFENAMLVWTAGVKTARFIQELKAEKNPQGRLKVDDYLRLNADCFVAGDASYVGHDNTYLRMAVQFAIAQGEAAAENIIRSINGRRLKEYKPVDLGYIIPMANNRSCGIILGIRMTGFIPTLAHYCMCIYRSCSLKNGAGIIKQLLQGGI
jgi:NADH:ubiquinone reductase (H+-translocating)